MARRMIDREPRGFFASLARNAMRTVIGFAIGTGAGALACWYRGLPLALGLLGGILVVALMLALMPDSLLM